MPRRYNLAQRVHDVQTYPIQSPQGATILLYGHNNGVTIVWRGGKRFKPTEKPPQKQNGNLDSDSVMIIDSDDEQPAQKASQAPTFVDKPQFEDEIEETPYPEITQTLDLSLGTSVLKVAVLPLAPRQAQDVAGGRAAVLGEKMVFAVSCVTNDIYIITVPLTPPSPESKARPELRSDLLASKAGSGAWGETLTLLGGQTQLSNGIALGLVLPDTPKKSANVVLASHSREASGVLRLWQVPLDSKGQAERAVEPFQTEYLPSPLTGLSFNPTHTTQLLAISSAHSVRVYDFAQSPFPPDPEQTGPYPAQGSWLISLYQPFTKATSLRKPIVDAAWISHGKAVFALLSDGMWGIWDIDGTATVGSSVASISTKLKSGVRGSAITAFSASGYIEGTSSLRSAAPNSAENQSGDFAPMTPHTRRQATASLGSAAGQDRLATVHGGIKVTVLPTAGQALPDEAVAFWIGSAEHVCVIPSVSRFWDSQLRRGSSGGANPFGSTQTMRLVKLQELSIGLLGERCCGIGLVAEASRAKDTGNATELPVDVLLRGETRLVIIRQSEDGPGKKVGGIAHRKRLFSKGSQSTAIIVHGKPRPASTSFNLSTAKPGTLRLKALPTAEETDMDDTALDLTPKAPKLLFGFGDTLDNAADTSADFSRNIEAEMLDLMDIDNALETMNGSHGRKKVLFREN